MSDGTFEALPEIVADLFGQLNKKIEHLDTHLGKVLQVHENEFLNAYRIHMIDIQKEIKQLKLKISEEEIKKRRDEELLEREKERDWFRDEALRLNKVCKEYMKSTEIWKSRTRMLEEDKKALEDRIKLLNKNTEKRENKSISQVKTLEIGKSFITESATTINVRSDAYYEATISHLKHEVENYKNIVKRAKGEKYLILNKKHELENLFEQCVALAAEEAKTEGRVLAKPFDELSDIDKRKVLYHLVSKPEVSELVKSFIFRTRKSETPSKYLQRNSTSSFGLKSHVFSTPKRQARVRHLPYNL